jgi:hypothetical protein
MSPTPTTVHQHTFPNFHKKIVSQDKNKRKGLIYIVIARPPIKIDTASSLSVFAPAGAVQVTALPFFAV